jgi:uncharacterized membrane protein YhhN
MMPFAGGIEANANATLVFSLVAAIAYAFVLQQPPAGLARSAAKRMVAKAMAVGLLAVLTAMQGGPWLLAGALGLSALGDALLARDGHKAVLGGLASFLAAHVVYAAAFLKLGDGAGVVLSQPWRAAVGVLMVAGAFGLAAVLRRRVAPFLHLPILVFGAVVLAMGLSGLAMNNAVVVAGAALLTASGGMFAWERLVAGQGSAYRGWMRLTIWAVYYAGQAAITLGVLVT